MEITVAVSLPTFLPGLRGGHCLRLPGDTAERLRYAPLP